MKSPAIRSMLLMISSSAMILALLCLTWSPASAQSGCHLREFDLCAATMLVFTQSSGGLAASEAEINKQCVHLKDSDSCFRNFTQRCTTSLQQGVIGMFANSSLALMGEYCTKGSQLRTNYLKHANCFNQVHKKDQKSCMRDLQTSLELLSSSKELSATGKRLQLACCTYKRFEGCLGGQLERRCGKEAVSFVNSVTRRAISRMPETLCRNYKPDGQECRAILPKHGTQPRGSKSSSILSRMLAAYTGL